MQARPIYGWVAVLTDSRNQIVDAVRSSQFLREEDIQSFDRSRLPDGRYRGDASDPIIIANAKALINVINSFEKFMPGLLENAASYGQAEGMFSKIYSGAWLVAGAAYQYKSIYEFIGDIRELIFYAKELKKTLVSLGGVNQEMLSIVAEIDNVIREQVGPIIQVVNQMQLSEDDQEDLRDDLSTIKIELEELIEPDSSEVVLEIEEEESLPIDIANRLAELKKSIEEVIGMKPDMNTGLYSIDETDNININRLKRVANAFENFRIALLKVDALMYRKEIYPFDIARSLGDAFLELQKIVDSGIYNELQNTSIDYLKGLISSMTQVIEPILLQAVNMMEMLDCKFGLNNKKSQEMRSQLDEICNNYNRFAQKIGVKLTHQYPYVLERITLIYNEALQVEDKIKQAKHAIKLVSEININERTPLHDLLKLQSAIRSVYTPRLYKYNRKLFYMIEEMTGIGKLKIDISLLEQKIKRNQNTKDDSKKLKELYGYLSHINAQMKLIESGGDHVDKAISYQDGKLVDHFIARSKRYIVNDSVRDDAKQHIHAYQEGLVRESYRLSTLADELVDNIPSSDFDSATNRLIELRQQVAKLDVLSLAFIPLKELATLKNQLTELPDDRVNEMIDLLSSVIDERSGVREERVKLEECRANIEKYNYQIDGVKIQLDNLNAEKLQLQTKHNKNDSQIIAVLERYRKALINCLEKTNDPDEMTIKNVASYLGIEVDEAKLLFNEGKTYWTGRAVFENPLVQKINSLIGQLTQRAEKEVVLSGELSRLQASLSSYQESERQITDELKRKEGLILDSDDFNDVQKYTWTVAGDFIAARRDALVAIRDLYMGPLAISQPVLNMVSTDLEGNTQDFSPAEIEIVRRLRADSAAVAKIKNAHAKMKEFASQIMSDHEAIQINDAEIDKLLNINVTDSLMLRFSKSTLNVMHHANSFMVAFEKRIAQYSSIENKIDYFYLLKDLLIEQKDMMRELIYSLSEMHRYGLQVKSVIPDRFSNLKQFLLPLIAQLQLMTQYSAGVLDVDTKKILNDLQALLEPTSNQNKLLPLDSDSKDGRKNQITILDPVISGMKRAIESKYSITLPDKKLKLKMAGKDEQLKSAIACLKSIRKIQSLMSVMANMSEGEDNLDRKIRLLGQLSLLYRLIKKIDMDFIKDLKSEIQQLLLSIHPYLVDFSINAELLELRAGLRNGILHRDIQELCVGFERVALKSGAVLDDYYPYYSTRSKRLKDEKTATVKERERVTTFSDLLRTIENDPNLLCKMSLNKLVVLHNGLQKLGISDATPLLDGVNLAIAERTGLFYIDQRTAQDKASLNKTSTEMVQVERDKLTCLIQLDVLSIRIERFTSIQKILSSNQPLREEDLLWLHANVENFKKKAFNEFCRLITSDDKGIIIREIDTQVRRARDQIRHLEQRQGDCEHRIAQLTAEAHKLNEVINTYSGYSLDVNNQIDRIACEASDKEVDIRISLKDFQVEEGAYPVSNVKFNAGNVSAVIEFAEKYQESLLARVKKIESIVEKYEQQASEVNERLKKDQILYLTALEKKVNLSSGRLTTLISSQSSVNIDTPSGLLTLCLNSLDANMKSKYTTLLNPSDVDEQKFAATLASTASKKTGPLGRFFRRILSIQSIDDDLFYLAKHFKKPKNINAYNTEMATLIKDAKKPTNEELLTQAGSTTLIGGAVGLGSSSNPELDTQPAHKQAVVLAPCEPQVSPVPTKSEVPPPRSSMSLK